MIIFWKQFLPAMPKELFEKREPMTHWWWLVSSFFFMPKNTSNDLSLNIGSGNDWVLSGNKSLPEPLLTHIHWSAVITRSDIVRYYMNNYKKCVRMSTRLWIHKRHPIPRPSGRAMGCPLRIFWENGLRYNGTALYLYMGSQATMSYVCCSDDSHMISSSLVKIVQYPFTYD